MGILQNVLTAEWILNIAVHSLSVLVIGWLFMQIFKHRAATLRSGIGLMTMLILAILPFLTLSFSSLEYTTLPIELGAAPALVEDNGPNPASGTEIQTSSSTPVRTGILSKIIGTGPFVIKIINLFGLLWVLGAALLLFRFVHGAVSLRKLKKSCVNVIDKRMNQILEETERTFARSIRTRVYESPKVICPMVLGFFKPFILIPHSMLRRMRDSDMRGILFHELSHIHHRDQITGVLQRIITIFNWWNPLAYNLSADLSRAREEISDNHVLLKNDSKEYAECLVNLAERTSIFRRLPVSTAMASSHIPLAERVKHILSKERNMETKLKKSTIWVIALVSFLFLGMIAGYRLTFATEESEAQTDTVVVNNPIPLENSQEKKKQTGKEIKSKAEKDQKTPVRAIGNLKPPKLIKKVEPVYPEIARQAKVEGTVILETTTDIYGRVQKATVLRSIPLLDQAAIDAVKQWVYEPLILDGKPIGVIFTVTCQFRLNDEKQKVTTKSDVEGAVMSGVVGGIVSESEEPLRAVGDIKPPKLIKKVEPVYPTDARKEGIEGMVILEATTDIHGRVQKTKVLRSIPKLNQAAIDAVKQWVYEPFIIDSKPRGVIFTVTCRFMLDKNEMTLVRIVGGIEPPKLIKKVDPIYPPDAKKEGIQGVIIIEVTTGIYGRVQKTKVLRSIPKLDQAAIDAVKQWVYNPIIIDSKPRGAIFKVTVPFKLDKK